MSVWERIEQLEDQRDNLRTRIQALEKSNESWMLKCAGLEEENAKLRVSRPHGPYCTCGCGMGMKPSEWDVTPKMGPLEDAAWERIKGEEALRLKGWVLDTPSRLPGNYDPIGGR